MIYVSEGGSNLENAIENLLKYPDKMQSLVIDLIDSMFYRYIYESSTHEDSIKIEEFMDSICYKPQGSSLVLLEKTNQQQVG